MSDQDNGLDPRERHELVVGYIMENRVRRNIRRRETRGLRWWIRTRPAAIRASLQAVRPRQLTARQREPEPNLGPVLPLYNHDPRH